MKVLVTGGAGFIGSAVIRYIISSTDSNVVNLDKLTYAGNLESLANVSDNDRYCFEKVDICDSIEVSRVLREQQPDAVMHLAAESHVDRSISGPADFIETNIVGTYVLLEAVREYWSGLDDERKIAFRFHHVSTDEVYGDLNGPTELFTEQTPYAPSSPYSASKASSDHLVRAWHRTYGLPVIVTNCSNNYGPYHFPEKLIPLTIINALEGRPLPIYGSGEQVRDWLYVDDHAEALYKVISQGQVGETYNIGGHNEMKNIDVVHALCSILDELRPRAKIPDMHNAVSQDLGKLGAELYSELIIHVQDRPGHDHRYAIDASKIGSELGWFPSETFDTGLRKTVEWYLDNPEWVERVKSGEYRNWLETNYSNRLQA